MTTSRFFLLLVTTALSWSLLLVGPAEAERRRARRPAVEEPRPTPDLTAFTDELVAGLARLGIRPDEVSSSHGGELLSYRGGQLTVRVKSFEEAVAQRDRLLELLLSHRNRGQWIERFEVEGWSAPSEERVFEVADGALRHVRREHLGPRAGFIVEHRPIVGSDAVGLSGLTLDDGGRAWAIAETGRLFQLREGAGSDRRLFAREVPLDDPHGLGTGLEPESIAWTGLGFVVGTERHSSTADRNVLVDLQLVGGRARVTSRQDVVHSWWSPGFITRENQGIEAASVVGSDLVIGFETVWSTSELRFAPVARRDGLSGEWSTFWLPLTTTEGKLSALSCRASTTDGALDCHGIERHFGIARLLRFLLPKRGTTSESRLLTLMSSTDLVPYFGELRNLEGLAVRRDGRVLLLIDNRHGGKLDGESELVVLTPR
ncbi:MAG: esterase-like activity of phytase family protein [Acidobacteriota bacterium]